MDDEFLLPSDRLEVGDEIARGSFGAVSKAKLYGMAVCAKVCLPSCHLFRGGSRARRRWWCAHVTGPSCSRAASSYIFV
jgi:hypothetical protein